MDQRLLLAADNGELSTVRKLLKKLPLVNVNATEPQTYSTALSKASKGGHFEIVRLLLEAQADVNTIDINNLTPLHQAAKGQHVEVVKLLILNGARLDATNRVNLKPIDLVRYNTETWEILHGARTGDLPELEEWSEVPIIPDFAIAAATGVKKKRKGTGKKKGKKGKKSGKKSGKKKKGKKKR